LNSEEKDEVDIIPYIRLLRLPQWLKNIMLFFPPVLGGVILQPGMLGKGIQPFISFCLASSSMYIFNDIRDRHHDMHHPVKRKRPIPSGKITLFSAILISIVFATCALFLAARISPLFMLILGAYLTISICYTVILKSIPIIDLFCISAGFLLRLQAGGEAFGITISEWLFLSVFLLAVFLSTGKRLNEKITLGDNAGNHRKALLTYPPGFLEGAMYMTGGAVLVTYTQYVISRHTLVYTVPLCCFGLMRYAFRVQAGEGGDPTESLLKDAPLFVTALLWVSMVVLAIYV
jgi:decaprenyl-phosphate phosphoribosyltransferase